ncbi:MAG: dihydropteroate synthase [Spirochaetes bacterium]|nr:MAG: dihydropteroate synthase [Spirochaetota bacterium]
MGILNVTPDSFHDGGRYADTECAVARAHEMIAEGADIVDVGGESSRPGAVPVSAQEEIDRVCPVIERIAREWDAVISVDTYKSRVAREALRAGARIVNDISGLGGDEAMAGVVAEHGARIVVMHMKGTPATMQQSPAYRDLLAEVREGLERGISRARAAGIPADTIIVDPGIGFGKTMEHNYEILRNIPFFKAMGYPVLIGLSRKSLIKGLYEGEADRLPATIALNAAAVMTGADIIRVHDVKEHRLAMAAIEMLKRVPAENGSAVR